MSQAKEILEEVELEKKRRKLRSDSGSKVTGLECSSCGHSWSRKVGPNMNHCTCPECSNDRVRISR